MVRAQLLLLFACTVAFGAWAAVLVVLQLLGRPPEAAAGSWPATGAGWLAAPPWWAPAALWLLANGLLIWRVRRARPAPAETDRGAEPPKPPTPTWRAPSAAPALPPSLNAILNPSRLVEGARLYRDDRDAWRARATLGADCPRLRVSLDVSALASDDGTWPPPERLLLATRTDLKQGDAIDIPVLDRVAGQAGAWRWAEEEARPVAPLPARPHRCRLGFAADVHSEESLYVVLFWACPTADGHSDPILVGETAFGFKDSWEAEAPLGRVPRWRGR